MVKHVDVSCSFRWSSRLANSCDRWICVQIEPAHSSLVGLQRAESSSIGSSSSGTLSRENRGKATILYAEFEKQGPNTRDVLSQLCSPSSWAHPCLTSLHVHEAGSQGPGHLRCRSPNGSRGWLSFRRAAHYHIQPASPARTAAIDGTGG